MTSRSSGGSWGRRRRRQAWPGVAVLATSLAWQAPALPADHGRVAAEAEGVFRAREAAGWLQLEQDQRQARGAAGSAGPADWSSRQAREQQERIELTDTLQRQQWQIDALSRTGRALPGGVGSPLGQEIQARSLLMRQGQELDALRLRQGLGRYSLVTPTAPAPPAVPVLPAAPALPGPPLLPGGPIAPAGGLGRR